MSPAVGAFDPTSPEVTQAYEGVATEAKLDTALAGLESLIEALRDAPNDGSSGFAVFDVTADVSCGGCGGFGAPPRLATLDAAADTDLGAPGAPLLLDDVTLNVLANFASDRAVTVGASGANIATGSVATETYTLDLTGDITAFGQLVLAGDGTVAVTGNNLWNVAPHVDAGTLRGNTGSLATDITSPASADFIAVPPVVEFL